MAAFDHNGTPGSALDRELRGLSCSNCDGLRRAHAALLEENAKLKTHAERMYRELKNPQPDSELVADHYRADFPKGTT